MVVDSSAHSAETPVIAIIGNQSAAPYQQMIDSFKASIQQARPNVKFIQPDSSDDENSQQSPDVVLRLDPALPVNH